MSETLRDVAEHLSWRAFVVVGLGTIAAAMLLGFITGNSLANPIFAISAPLAMGFLAVVLWLSKRHYGVTS